MPESIAEIPSLPKRSADSHKGDFGRALLIGGSRGMSGAISLCGRAAIRSGAGLVKLAVPDRTLETVASFDPCYMTVPLPDDSQGRIEDSAFGIVNELASQATCAAIGPGLGRSAGLQTLVARLYSSIPVPLVVDADALNALSETETVLAEAAGPRIVTPHFGEFRRLIGGDDISREEAVERAEALAVDHRVVIVLKGNQTVVTDGSRSYINTTGNPGMATGGTGDVLTGVIAALVCQQLDPFEAAVLGVYVHGKAGDLAVNDIGQASLNAQDIVEHLMAAFKAIETDSK